MGVQVTPHGKGHFWWGWHDFPARCEALFSVALVSYVDIVQLAVDQRSDWLASEAVECHIKHLPMKNSLCNAACCQNSLTTSFVVCVSFSGERSVMIHDSCLWRSLTTTVHSRHPLPADTRCVNMPEEDRTTDIGNMHKNLVKIARVVPDISSLTDRQTYSSQYLATAAAVYSK